MTTMDETYLREKERRRMEIGLYVSSEEELKLQWELKGKKKVAIGRRINFFAFCVVFVPSLLASSIQMISLIYTQD